MLYPSLCLFPFPSHIIHPSTLTSRVAGGGPAEAEYSRSCSYIVRFFFSFFFTFHCMNIASRVGAKLDACW